MLVMVDSRSAWDQFGINGDHEPLIWTAIRRRRDEKPDAEHDMELERNLFKAGLAAGQVQIGIWSSLCSSIGVDILSDSGFDWILLDTEHSPNELPDLLHQVQACQRRSTPIVRPAWNDAVLLKRILDIGVQAVLIPFVENKAEAERAVAACRYPPVGTRGISTGARASHYGRTKDYLKNADSEICILVQVETGGALARIEEIASVDGVDGVFIGPSDLSASLGHIGNPHHPEVQTAIEQAVRRLTAIGKPAGILAPIEQDARRYLEWGYGFVAVGSDTGLLARHADALAKSFKPG
jgi:4-hydroxy-2-oxoheptanedioate aldolase